MSSPLTHNWLWLWSNHSRENKKNNACAYEAMKASECTFAHVVCLSSCQCFCILSAVDCLVLCLALCVSSVHFSVSRPVTACFLLHWFVLSTLLVCVFCACVCIGRYCRSARSCRISCKEHEPPGNAQKHQHWWHQHKSAKFTLLQIVAARSRTCRCQPMFTVMQSVYHNLNSPTFIKTINLQGTVWSDTPCTCAFSFFLCYFSQFEVKVSIYLWMVHSLRLTEGWLMTFSSLESAKVFTWKRIAWQEVTFWGRLTSLFFSRLRESVK